MREASTALIHDLPPEFNTTQLLVDRLAREDDAPLFSVKRDGSWIDVSTADFVADVRSLAKMLLAAGIGAGQCVGIMSRTRYEWALAEQAIWFAGAVSVPIYETSSPHQVAWILEDSGARHVFAEDPGCARVIGQAAGSLGEEVTVWSFEQEASPADSCIPAAGLRELVAAGAASQVGDVQVETARTAAGLRDLATLVYTSGTTGRPKGCMMTHANFSLIAVNLTPHMAPVLGTGERTLMFLPLAHVLARAVQQVCVHAGSTIAHTPSASTLVQDLAAVRPGFLLAVPRIFEKIRATAAATAQAAGKERLFAQAESAAIEYSRSADARARGLASRRSPVRLARHALFNKVLYPRLRAVLGGRVRYAICGASALNADLAHFFRGAGVGLLEGYGLTETTAPATVNMAANPRVGSVGVPIPGTTIRIAPDGEVLVRGIGVFAGYHRNARATAAAFDGEGFFRTGDTGTLDEAGFLRITGRKKDILVTAGGKNVAPGPLEEIIRSSPLVSQVVLVGENRPFIAALLTLDPDEIAPWCRANSLPALSVAEAAVHPAVLAGLQAAVDAANATVSRAEGIRKFAVLDSEFTEESGHLTPSLKVKRASVAHDFRARIDELYSR
ncbi:AMP-dependent synthetase/ligase [Paeniglutamicibacter sp. ABSL32-1]|nr:AMP-dependent synthetase/ligase [Paeniglutamicibacter quisquiliarum]MBV1779179.1 AMP-dependent synthetase/ligase [Paeniglutamicibacter quisquiliarum]